MEAENKNGSVVTENKATENGNGTTQTKSENPKNIKACASPNCSKPATLQCPSCLKQGLEKNSWFCDQDCFKGYWPVHKYFHKQGMSPNRTTIF